MLETATYQLDDAALRRRGLCEPEIAEVWLRAHDLARRAAEPTGAFVATSLGSRAAFSPNGGEYRGEIAGDLDSCRDFHRGRIARARQAGSRLLALETLPRADELELILVALATSGIPEAWVSFVTPDGHRLPDGTPLEDVAARSADCPSVVAVGVNCCGPEVVEEALSRLRFGTALPLLAYPNSGENWRDRSWCGHGQGPESWPIARWRALGLNGLGGCCRIAADALQRAWSS